MKKLIPFLLLLALIPTLGIAQALEDIIVEKIPVTAEALAADPSLKPGTVAYRVFVDMAPGYEMQMVYGQPGNSLIIKTTTSFYNNIDGVTSGRSMSNSLFNDPAVRFDSYITVDGVTSSRVGILITEDTDGTPDGYTTGTSLSLQTIGADFETPFGTEPFSGEFSTDNGGYNVLGGEVGTTATNRVLIGQFTTDGVLSFELNVQLRPVAVGDQINFVARNAVGSDIEFSKLIYSSTSSANLDPVVTLTSPATGTSFKVNDPVSISANASDADGSITKVEFFIDGTKEGEDNSSPWQYTWNATAGSHQITARATDDKGAQKTSSPVSISVSAPTPVPPVVSVTAPTNGAVLTTSSPVTIRATATDTDGTIAKVEFFVNGTSIGEDISSPFEIVWNAVQGTTAISAKATDNSNTSTTSESVTVTVNPGSSNLPVVNITSPGAGSHLTANSQVVIEATASDAGGSITKVEFLVNGTKIGEDNTAPYQITWTALTGTRNLLARATDNEGNQVNSSVVTVLVNAGTSPVVSISGPASGATIATGSVVSITANASDQDGTITKVEFFVNGTKIGEDGSAPYSYDWTSISGAADITAKATDNAGYFSTSATVSIMVGTTPVDKDTVVFDFSKVVISGTNYNLPVSVISTGDVTEFHFTMNINTSKITFNQILNNTTYLNNTSTFDQLTKLLSIASTSNQPVEKKIALLSLSFNLMSGAISPADLTNFKAYINNSPCEVKLILAGSSPVNPTVSIAAPSAGSTFTVGTQIPVTATAADADGTVVQVEFFVNGVSIGKDNASPYSVNWTGIAGSVNLSATATDNQGNTASSAIVSITVIASDNVPPSVSITSPANGQEFASGQQLTIKANAADNDGNVVSVEFYVNNAKIGKDATAPYQINWIAESGVIAIKAIATDNKGATGTSEQVTIAVNAQPTIAVSSPTNGAAFTAGEIVTITANATDGDGNITLVEFFIRDVKVGEDGTAPYTYEWTSTPGVAAISAMVTDAKGAKTNSEKVTIFVNSPPSVEITNPAEGSILMSGETITIEASAADQDGTIQKVEFFINGNSIGADSTLPYQQNWVTVEGTFAITAAATDNKGAVVISDPVNIKVIVPYEITSVAVPCNGEKMCIPLTAKEVLSNVIGFDIKMKYNGQKAKPTGVVTLGSDLIQSSYADYATADNTTDGTILISVFLKPAAPKGTSFSGTGELLCVEFSKQAGFDINDTVEFSVISLSESYITGVVSKSVKPGHATAYKDYTFKGSLKYWSNNSALAYNKNNPTESLITNISGSNSADCSLTSAESVQPDMEGNFNFDIRSGDALVINRDILPDSEVQTLINGMDAQLAMKVLLDDPDFIPTPFQILGMDVNLDGIITSGDLSQINQRSILMIEEYRQAWNYNDEGVKIVDQPSKDWIFASEKNMVSDKSFILSTVFPDDDGQGYSKYRTPALKECLPLNISNLEGCPAIEPETFKGVMLGDINGNYNDVPTAVMQKGTNMERSSVIFDLSHATIAGNIMEFPVYITAEYAVTSLDFQLRFGTQKLELDTIISHAKNINPTFFYKESDTTLRFTSYSLTQYSVNESLISIRFELLNSNISKGDFMVPLALLNGETVAYEIKEYDPVTGTELPEVLSDIRIYPNPARNKFFIASDETVELDIMDINGRLMLHQDAANSGDEINIESLSEGLYLVRFKNGMNSCVRKLVINR
jgi:hypothetical protein